MKVQTRVVIILTAIILCCSMFGSAFALYVVNSPELTLSFSGKADEVVEYFLKISENGTEVATIKLSENAENNSEYSTTAYLKPTYKVDFYKNYTLLSNSVDYTYQTGSDITATKPAPNEFNYAVTYTTSATGKATAKFALDRTTYYLVGDNNGWSIDGENAIKFVPNPSNPNEVMALGVPFTAGQGFKIRNYAGYYSTAKDDSPEIFKTDSETNIVPQNGGKYDFYFDTTSNSVYFKNSEITYTTITSYQNASWILNGDAWLIAVGSDGKFYKITYTNYGTNDITVNVYVPSTLASVTVMRASPTVTYENFATYQNNGSYVWNKVTIQKSNYGSNGKIWS